MPKIDKVHKNAYRSLSGASESMLVSDGIIRFDTSAGARTFNLLTAVGREGHIMEVEKTTTDLNGLTIDPNSTETIGGKTTYILYTVGEKLRFRSNGTNWDILDHTFAMEPVAFTPTTSGFGTISGVECYYERVSKTHLQLIYFFIVGTTTAVEAQVGLPGSLTLNDAVYSTDEPDLLGVATSNAALDNLNVILATGNDTYFNFSRQDNVGTINKLLPQTASSIFASSLEASFACLTSIKEFDQ